MPQTYQFEVEYKGQRYIVETSTPNPDPVALRQKFLEGFDDWQKYQQDQGRAPHPGLQPAPKVEPPRQAGLLEQAEDAGRRALGVRPAGGLNPQASQVGRRVGTFLRGAQQPYGPNEIAQQGPESPETIPWTGPQGIGQSAQTAMDAVQGALQRQTRPDLRGDAPSPEPDPDLGLSPEGIARQFDPWA